MCDCNKMELFNNGKNVMFPLSFGTAFQKAYFTEIKQLGKCFGKLLGRNLNFGAFIQLKVKLQNVKHFSGLEFPFSIWPLLYCPCLTFVARLAVRFKESLFFHTLKFSNPLLLFFFQLLRDFLLISCWNGNSTWMWKGGKSAWEANARFKKKCPVSITHVAGKEHNSL